MFGKNSYTYKIKLYENQTSLEYIIKVHIEYMFFSLILPMNPTSGDTVQFVVPFTKPNVFIICCQILYFMKKFTPHVDHFMHNETTQIVDYI